MLSGRVVNALCELNDGGDLIHATVNLLDMVEQSFCGSELAFVCIARGRSSPVNGSVCRIIKSRIAAA
jgi:hypothetical protein